VEADDGGTGLRGNVRRHGDVHGTLELGDIQMVDFNVYVGDKRVEYQRHHNPDIESANDRFRIYEKFDQRRKLLDYLRGTDPNQFEVAVLNLLSTAGYVVQWFGDSSYSVPNFSNESNDPELKEIDIIAHAPDDSHIAFVECTTQQISEKASLLDRIGEATAGILDEERIRVESEPGWAKKPVACIATPQSPDQLSSEVVESLESMGVVVLDSEKLVSIYELSAEQDELVSLADDLKIWNWDG
jgi:hypothetical protein